MKFAIVFVALLGAQLLDVIAAASLEEESGLTAPELEKAFGRKMGDIERSSAGLDPEALKEALRSSGNLEPAQVLSLLQQAGVPTSKLYNRHTVEEFLELTRRDPNLCTVDELKRIVELQQANRYTVKEFAIRDNMIRYSRQQFNELFEYCLKQTQAKAFTEQLRRLYSKNSNKAGEKVHQMTDMEKLILNDMTAQEVISKLSNFYKPPHWIAPYLTSIVDDNEVLLNGHTVSEFKSILEKDSSLCTVKELKRRIMMHHGEDADKSNEAPSMLESNLTEFCREHLNELVQYCLANSQDGEFKSLIGKLYMMSENNAAPKQAGHLTPMESVILRMPSEK